MSSDRSPSPSPDASEPPHEPLPHTKNLTGSRPFLDPTPEGRLIERWFAELTIKWLRRGALRSTKQLEEAIQSWVDTWND